MLPPPFAAGPTAAPLEVPRVDLRDFEAVAADAVPEGAALPRPSDLRRAGFRARLEVGHPGVPCHRPFTNVSIEGQDRVMPCPWYKGELGHLSSDGSMANVFFGDKAQALRETMRAGRLGEGCKACPVLDGYQPEQEQTVLRRAIRALRRG